MIKAIIFDFAGVIGNDAYWVWLREKIPDLENKKSYFQDLSVKVDRGDISNREFTELAGKGVNVPAEDVWKEIFKRIKINYPLLDLISRLKKRYKTGLLTNYTHEWMEELISTYQLDKYFDVKVISSLYKKIKPGSEIYKITLDLLKVKPDEAIFIDDRQINVDGGEKAGIRSFLFTSDQKLMEDLRGDNIIF